MIYFFVITNMAFRKITTIAFLSGLMILLQLPRVNSICTSGYYPNEMNTGCLSCESEFYCHKGIKRPCQPNATSPSESRSISECFCKIEMKCIPYHSTEFSMTLDQFITSKKGLEKSIASVFNIQEDIIVFETEDDESNKNQNIKIKAFIPFLFNHES